MSTQKDIKLTPIAAPELSDVAFGENIRLQFANINKNFDLLANRDFIKGEDGKSLEIFKLHLKLQDSEDGWITDLRNDLMIDIENAIQSGFTTEELTDVSYKHESNIITLNWKDNLITEESVIYLIFKDHEIYSSLPYVFLDKRFNAGFNRDYVKYNSISSSWDSISEEEAYSNLSDVTTTLYIESTDTGYTVTKSDAWPTLYYDKDINDFCWKYQGQESRLPARGPKGEDMKLVLNMFNVTVDESLESSREIKEVMKPDGTWTTISDYVKNCDIYGWPKITASSTAVVFENKISKSIENAVYWISVINLIDGGSNILYKVTCSDKNSITSLFNAKSFIDLMNTISPTVGNHVKSFFIPIIPSNKNDKSAHCIFSSKSTNHPGVDGFWDLNLAGLTDYDSVATDSKLSLSTSALHLWYNTNIKGKLNINGACKLNDNLSVSKTVTVGGNLYLQGINNFNILRPNIGDEYSLLNFLTTGGASVGKPMGENGEIFNDYTNNKAGTYAHAEGKNTWAYGQNSHAEGFGSKNIFNCNIISQSGNIIKVKSIDYKELNFETGNVIQFDDDKSNLYIIKEKTSDNSIYTLTLDKTPNKSYASQNIVINNLKGIAYGNNSAVSGSDNISIGTNAVAYGLNNRVFGDNSFASGSNNIINNINSIAAGNNNVTFGENNMAIGTSEHNAYNVIPNLTTNTADLDIISKWNLFKFALAFRDNCFIGGSNCIALGTNSIAFGNGCRATGDNSLAFGVDAFAYGTRSHAEGNRSIATGYAAHAEGQENQAKGEMSHAEGDHNVISTYGGHVEGRYNFNEENLQSIIGIGSSDLARKNGVAMKNDGKLYILGVGNYSGLSTKDCKDLATVIKDTINAKTNISLSTDATGDNISGLKLDAGNRLSLNIGDPLIIKKSGLDKNHILTIGTATANKVGVIKLGYTDNGNNLGLRVNDSLQAYVTLPDDIKTIPTASSNSIGGIKTGFTPTGDNYAVALDNSGNAYVHVPAPATPAPTPTPGGGGSDKQKIISLLAIEDVDPTTYLKTSLPESTLGNLIFNVKDKNIIFKTLAVGSAKYYTVSSADPSIGQPPIIGLLYVTNDSSLYMGVNGGLFKFEANVTSIK